MIDGWAITASVHIWPVNDLIEHEQSPLCPCLPKSQETREGGTRIWQYMHRSLDGRELNEPAA